MLDYEFSPEEKDLYAVIGRLSIDCHAAVREALMHREHNEKLEARVKELQDQLAGQASAVDELQLERAHIEIQALREMNTALNDQNVKVTEQLRLLRKEQSA